MAHHYWTQFLTHNENDPYYLYRDKLRLMTENLVSDIMVDYKKNYPETSTQELQKFAVNLLMEQTLALQYEHAPNAQGAMAVALITELPQLGDWRIQFMGDIEKIIINKQHQNKWWNKLKFWV